MAHSMGDSLHSRIRRRSLDYDRGYPRPSAPLFESSLSSVEKKMTRMTRSLVMRKTTTSQPIFSALRFYSLRLIPLTSLFAAFFFISYFALRFHCTIVTSFKGSGPWSHAGEILFLLAEFGLMFQTFLNHILRSLALGGRQPMPRLRYAGPTFPSVDIFITCCGEDASVIADTIKAANAIMWPRDKFRIVLLDDGSSHELKALVDRLRLTHSNVFYTARKKGPIKDYKAGNLNHGFRYVETLPGGASTFVAALDVDMIPEPHWIQALMPHLLSDRKISLAQPPQCYYNVPENDPLLQGLDVNYQVVEPLKHSSGVIWCGGSAYLMRRSAIDDIGGVPTGSVGEDMYISQILFAKGWDSVYINEPLQYGLIPETFQAHTKQQTRWHVSPIQIANFMRFYMFRSTCGKMTFQQRVTGVLFAAIAVSYVLAAISLVAVPIAMLIGQPLVEFPDSSIAQTMMSHCFYFYLCNWLDDCLVAISTNYRIAIRRGHFSLWMAPYHAKVLSRAFFLPRWLGGVEAGFSSTGTRRDDFFERDSDLSPALLTRLRGFLTDNMLWFHLIYVLVCVIGVIRAGIYLQSASANSTAEWLMKAFGHIGWGPLLWTTCITTCATPLWYAIWPPTVPPRESLLKRSSNSDARYPVQKSRQTVWSSWSILPEIQYTLCMMYLLACFMLIKF